jgi:predicted RNA binding protein YcfA (HicA-like mRNA interferase family)
MAAIEKLVRRMRNSPAGVRYDEVVRVLLALGWVPFPGGDGSHQRFDAPGGGRFMVVVRPHGRRRHVSPRAVTEVLLAWDASRPERGGTENRDAE